jgi:uncharacterized membrane protein YfhO
VAIERTDLLFRGCVVPAGAHRLALDYVPEGWGVARALALAGWLAPAALAALWLRGGRAARVAIPEAARSPA